MNPEAGLTEYAPKDDNAKTVLARAAKANAKAVKEKRKLDIA